MINIYLIRHGIKENVPFDPLLTKKGKELAKATAKYLKKISLEAIIASHKSRAKQTAEIIAKPHNLPIITDERLQERMEWEHGKSFEEFMFEWGKTDLDRTYVPETGSSSQGKGKIMKTVIEELANKYKKGNIAIVTHGGAIGDLLRNLFPDEPFAYQIESISGAKYIDILECSITIIKKEKEDYKLIEINDIDHLS